MKNTKIKPLQILKFAKNLKHFRYCVEMEIQIDDI